MSFTFFSAWDRGPIVLSFSPCVTRMYPPYPLPIFFSFSCSSNRYPLMLITPPRLRIWPKSARSNATVPPCEKPNKNILEGSNPQSSTRCWSNSVSCCRVRVSPLKRSGLAGVNTIHHHISAIHACSSTMYDPILTFACQEIKAWIPLITFFHIRHWLGRLYSHCSSLW